MVGQDAIDAVVDAPGFEEFVPAALASCDTVILFVE